MGFIDFSRQAWESALTLGKVALKSRCISKTVKDKDTKGGPIIVLGNGPSLRDTIKEGLDILKKHPAMAVNFAANSPEFFELKPKHYILADPHFFSGVDSDPNVGKLWENIAKADWGMTLHVPIRMKKWCERFKDKALHIEYFNMTPGEGFDGLCHILYNKKLAMPRPRNVLVPAIMQAMALGHEDVYIVGADHTWPHTLYVDDQNRVVSVQPHFYQDNKKELDRVAEAYAGIHIHDVLQSMVIAFRSYHQIEKYANKKGIRIYNATPGSLIDAFKRKPLSDLR